MKSIYNLLKKEIKQNPIIQNSILSDTHPWKRSHYIILAEIIKEELSKRDELRNERKFELGTSISHMTLQRFFENDYDFKTHNDLRFLKTLDKICIFLGFNDLNAFVSTLKEKDGLSDIGPEKLFSEDVIYNYCKTNFEFFKLFPVLDINIFDELIFNDAPFRERIKNYSTKLCERKLKLFTSNNRSNYEIFDFEIISEEDDKIVVKTQEFWNLVFTVEYSGEVYIVNELNTQIYFLRKTNNVWKIWDNYNPNSGLLNNELEKSRS